MLVITETDHSAPVRLYVELFRDAVHKAGSKEVRFLDARNRNHFSIVVGLAAKTADPSRTAMVEFIRERCRQLDQ